MWSEYPKQPYLLQTGPSYATEGFPGGASVKEPACQWRRHKRHGFNPWVGNNPLEEAVAAHFCVLAWRIPWTEEPGRLQSIESQRVGHGWSDLTRHEAWHNPRQYTDEHVSFSNFVFMACILKSECACVYTPNLWFNGCYSLPWG